MSVQWKDIPDDHDYPAAVDYLELLVESTPAQHLAERLRKAPVTHKKAKDILRAARLPLLPADNAHVAADLTKIAAGTPLSPILLVRGDLAAGTPVQIADGYHRVCASYHTDENTDIPVKIISARD